MLGGNDLGLTPLATVQSQNSGEYTFHKEGESVMDMRQGFTTIYGYMEVVESRVVGDRLPPLFRSVQVYGQHGSTISNRFDNVQYVPLFCKEFGTIEIERRHRNTRAIRAR